MTYPHRLIIQSCSINELHKIHIEIYKIAVIDRPYIVINGKIIQCAEQLSWPRNKSRAIIVAKLIMSRYTTKWMLTVRRNIHPTDRMLYKLRAEYLARNDMLYGMLHDVCLRNKYLVDTSLVFHYDKISKGWIKYYLSEEHDMYYKFHIKTEKRLIEHSCTHSIESRNIARDIYVRKQWAAAFNNAIIIHDVLCGVSDHDFNYGLNYDICSIIIKIIHCGMTSGKIL